MTVLAQNIMTKIPAVCLPETPLQEVALEMLEHDCGAIPVVESHQTPRLVGVITDRDITCRAVAEGKNPLTMTAQECLSAPAVTITPDTTLEDCCKIMAENQVRRL